MDEQPQAVQSVAEPTAQPVTAVPPSSPPAVSARKRAFWEMPKYGIMLVALLAASGASVYFYSQAKQRPEEKPVPVMETPSPTAVPLSLDVSQPRAGDTAIDGEFLVRGSTQPRASVALYTDSDEAVVESDERGTFEGTVTVEKGENTLTVTAFGQDGQEKSESMVVSY